MEWLLTTLITLLAVLVVLVIWLILTLRRIKKMETTASDRAEAAMQLPESVMPSGLQQKFEDIAQRQLKYFDTMLQTTVTSFDHELHASLQNQQTANTKTLHKQFEAVSKKLEDELNQLSADATEKSKDQLQLLDAQTKKLDKIIQERLAESYTELAWQYIAQSLGDSIDLHSQKEMIVTELDKYQDELRKDFNHD